MSFDLSKVEIKELGACAPERILLLEPDKQLRSRGYASALVRARSIPDVALLHGRSFETYSNS